MHVLTLNIDHLGLGRLGHAGLYTAARDIAVMLDAEGVRVSEVWWGRPGSGPQRVAPPVSPAEAAALLAGGEITAIYTQYIQTGRAFELAAHAWPRVVPIVSICHDLVDQMDAVVAWCASPARHPADLAVISTRAGERALRKMLGRAGAGSSYPPAEVEILPLGTFQPRYDGTREGARGELGWGPEETVYLWLGRFSDTYKADLRVLLLAFRSLLARGRVGPSRLVLAGSDPSGMSSRLRRLAGDLGVADRVSWLPDAEPADRDRCLAGADVLVNVSDHVQETFGLANVEAMAHGMPVVAGDWSGFPEVVEDGVTGLLVPMWFDAGLLDSTNPDRFTSLSVAAGLDFSALVEVLERLGLDPALRARLGAAGADSARRRFAWRALAPRYVELFRRRHALAQEFAPRACPRPWMSQAFSHYATRRLEGPSRLRPGPTPLANALDAVDDPALRDAMRAAAGEADGPVWGPIAHTEGVPWRRLALLLLIKFGVLELVEPGEPGPARSDHARLPA